MNLFSMGLDKIHLGNHVRLFEAFSGIGTQAMALKRLGVTVEHIGFSEIDKYAIQSYLAIHGDVKNYGDITKMTEIPPCDIFTWSFPCTDLSKAGKQKGLDGTRSGLGFEVIRLLHATKDKPKVLLMENVPDLLSPKFRDGWQEIYHEIEKLGYTNYVEVLNAKNYGVAQNRDRVFMVSILGNYAYEFPKPFELTKRLKDYLESEVDEKYYLSDKQLKAITNPKYESMGIDRIPSEYGITNAITTSQGGNREPKIAYALSSREFKSRGWLDESPTLTARDYKDPKVILEPYCINSKVDVCGIVIPENTKQGYAVAKDGDGVYINRPHQKRGVVQKEMIQTIKTSGQDVGVVVGYSEYSAKKILGNLVDKEDIVGTITANAMQSFNHDNCHIIKDEQKIVYVNDVEIIAILEGGSEIVKINNKTYLRSKYNYFRIRKLTPKECWRLMGISDEDYNKTMKVGMSNSQLYKQAGNAIVVDVLVEIFRGLL